MVEERKRWRRIRQNEARAKLFRQVIVLCDAQDTKEVKNFNGFVVDLLVDSLHYISELETDPPVDRVPLAELASEALAVWESEFEPRFKD